MAKNNSNKKKQDKKERAENAAREEEIRSREGEQAVPAADEEERSSSEAAAKPELVDELEELKNLNQDLNNRILRLRADFDNFRKRTVKERQDVARRANEGLLEEIIPVLDHFEMGLQNAAEHDIPESVYNGFKLVYEQLLRAIEKAGVERIDAEGQEFNPHLHECISHLPSEDVEEGQVTAQTRCGYKLGNYVLRAAQVVVSSGPTGDKEDENEPNKEEE